MLMDTIWWNDFTKWTILYFICVNLTIVIIYVCRWAFQIKEKK